MNGSTSLGRGSGFVTAAALALVVSADLLFYGHPLGWTAGIFATCLVLLLLLRGTSRRFRRATWIIAAAALALALTLVEEPTPLAIWVTMIAMVLLAMTSRQGWTGSVRVWIERWGSFLLAGWLKIIFDAITGVKWIRRHPAAGKGGPAAAVWSLAKWVIPLLLGSVFVGLFALANPIVERWVSHFCDWIAHALDHVINALPDMLDLERLSFWMVVLLASWALLRVRTHRGRAVRRAGTSMTPPKVSAARIVMPVSQHALVIRCLIVFNAVFAMETILDLFYLTGGRHLPAGITFKQYAHRGSYPLIATALLAAAFVLIAFRRDAQGKGWRIARLLVYAWIAQNVLLTISAGWRLLLLVNASNLTRLRLATTLWLALVAIGLLTIVVRIVTRRDSAWLLRVNIAMAAIVIYACCFLNLDGFIANYNADHCMEVARNGDVLGLTYLRDLGIESIPALDRLSITLDTPDRRAMAHRFAEQLRGEVYRDLKTWRGWTWRRSRLGSTIRGWKPPAQELNVQQSRNSASSDSHA